jgi:hypothetical protein
MFCSNCGASLTDTVKFCSSCGTKVGESISADGADWGRLRWGISKADVAREYEKEGIHAAREGNGLALDKVDVAGYPFKGFLGFDAKSLALTHVILTSRRSDEIWHDVLRSHINAYGADPVRSIGDRLLWHSERSRIRLEDDESSFITLEYSDKRLAGRPWIEDWLAPLVEAADKDHALLVELLTLAGSCYQTRRRQGPTGDLPPMSMVKNDRTGHFSIIFEHISPHHSRTARCGS